MKITDLRTLCSYITILIYIYTHYTSFEVDGPRKLEDFNLTKHTLNCLFILFFWFPSTQYNISMLILGWHMFGLSVY